MLYCFSGLHVTGMCATEFSNFTIIGAAHTQRRPSHWETERSDERDLLVVMLLHVRHEECGSMAVRDFACSCIRAAPEVGQILVLLL